MTLLAIAEVLSGEALVSPGGPIDRDTAITDDLQLWGSADDVQPEARQPQQLELGTESEPDRVLVTV